MSESNSVTNQASSNTLLSAAAIAGLLTLALLVYHQFIDNRSPQTLSVSCYNLLLEININPEEWNHLTEQNPSGAQTIRNICSNNAQPPVTIP